MLSARRHDITSGRVCPLLATVAILAVTTAGCGGGSDKRTPSGNQQDALASGKAAIDDVLRQLQQASVDGDGEKICKEIFTAKLAEAVSQAATSKSCPTEVESKLFSPETQIDVQEVTVADRGNATATIREANGNVSTVFFVRQKEKWRIRSVQPV